MTKTHLVLAFFVFALMLGLFARMGHKHIEKFMNQPVGSPLDAEPMGPYDGSPSTTSVMQGSVPAETSGLLPGSSDGLSLNYLAGNTVSKDCCPSMLSTDTGCVCLSKGDKDFMASRGGNSA